MLPDTDARFVHYGYNATCEIGSTEEKTVRNYICAEMPGYGILSSFSCSVKAYLPGILSY